MITLVSFSSLKIENFEMLWWDSSRLVAASWHLQTCTHTHTQRFEPVKSSYDIYQRRFLGWPHAPRNFSVFRCNLTPWLSSVMSPNMWNVASQVAPTSCPLPSKAHSFYISERSPCKHPFLVCSEILEWSYGVSGFCSCNRLYNVDQQIITQHFAHFSRYKAGIISSPGKCIMIAKKKKKNLKNLWIHIIMKYP